MDEEKGTYGMGMDDDSAVYTDTVNELLARVAEEQGLLTPEQIELAREEQERDRASGATPPRTLGVILVEKGFLTNAHLVRLLQDLRNREPEDDRAREETRLGTLLLRRRVVTPPQLAECLRAQQDARGRDETVIPRLGEILVQRGYAEASAVHETLAVQAEARVS